MIDVSKRILITGGTGYIGAQLIQRLISLGATNIYVSSNSKKEIPGVCIYNCDLRSDWQIRKMISLINPEIIFHLGALGAKNSQNVYSLYELIEVNALGTIYLMNAARENSICECFLNISSSYEYGPKSEFITEKSLLSPSGDYAISKSIGSMYGINLFNEYQFPVITYRLFSCYGGEDSGRIIPLILAAMKDGGKLRLFDVYRKRDFVHIDTVISAILEVDKVLKKNINILNIGSGDASDIYSLVLNISNKLAIPLPENIIFETSEVPLAHWQCDNSLLKTIGLDVISFEDGLTKTLTQYI